MRLLLDPQGGFFPGGGYTPGVPGVAVPVVPTQASPTGYYGQAAAPTVAPAFQGQGQQFAGGYQPAGGAPTYVNPYSGQPAPVGSYANPIQPNYQVQPQQSQQPQAQAFAQPGPPAQPGQYPFQAPGQQTLPAQPFVYGVTPIQPPGPAGPPAAMPYQAMPPAYVAPYQAPAQPQPVAPGQSQFPATLAGPSPLDREPTSLAEAQAQLASVRMERIQSQLQAGNSQKAFQDLQAYYQGQLTARDALIGQRDQALAAATCDQALGNSLAGVAFRDQACAINCRYLIGLRLEVAADGQVREKGTGRPAAQAIPEYLRGDLGVFLAPSTQGGAPAPVGQFGNPNPAATPASPGEQLVERWRQGVAAQMGIGNFPTGYQAASQGYPGFGR